MQSSLSSRELAKASSERKEGLIDYIARVSPELERPTHLARAIAIIEESERRPVRAIINTPPQHGKSTLAFHAITWFLQRPIPVAYISYSDAFVMSQMRKCRSLAERAGVLFKGDSRSYSSWDLQNGGSLFATGREGSITGRPAKRIVLDDILKSWAEAQSRTVRDSIFDGILGDIITRVHADTSIFFFQTRWHEDDPCGRLARQGWEVINLPAINDNGEALWPSQRPLSFLEYQRKELGDYRFAALYQGRPRPPDNQFFTGVSYYDELPNEMRYGIGIDLAYSGKTKGDYSVAVVLGENDGHYYVLDVVRKQVQATEFALSLKAMQAAHPGSTIRWRCSGTEEGVAQWLKERGIHLKTDVARHDKFVNATPLAAAWNQGKVSIPRSAPWADKFVGEILDFTGDGDAHDDQVDALASAFTELHQASSYEVETSLPRVTSTLKGYW